MREHERKEPWVSDHLTGGTGFEPRASRTGAGEPEAVASLLNALVGVNFPASREELIDVCNERPDCSIWARLLRDLPRRSFANARELKEALTTALREREGAGR